MPRSLTIPISSGSDPEPIEIDDAVESVGEIPPDTCEDILFDLINDDCGDARAPRRKLKEKR